MSALGSDLFGNRSYATIITITLSLQASHQGVAIAMEMLVNVSISTQAFYYFIILKTE